MRNMIVLVASVVALSGCVEDTGPKHSGKTDGLKGSAAQFDSMVKPCKAQASRLTGTPRNAVAVLGRIRTGGGPILTLSAAGSNYTCRLEPDGSVTVFSEFAN